MVTLAELLCPPADAGDSVLDSASALRRRFLFVCLRIGLHDGTSTCPRGLPRTHARDRRRPRIRSSTRPRRRARPGRGIRRARRRRIFVGGGRILRGGGATSFDRRGSRIRRRRQRAVPRRRGVHLEPPSPWRRRRRYRPPQGAERSRGGGTSERRRRGGGTRLACHTRTLLPCGGHWRPSPKLETSPACSSRKAPPPGLDAPWRIEVLLSRPGAIEGVARRRIFRQTLRRCSRGRGRRRASRAPPLCGAWWSAATIRVWCLTPLPFFPRVRVAALGLRGGRSDSPPALGAPTVLRRSSHIPRPVRLSRRRGLGSPRCVLLDLDDLHPGAPTDPTGASSYLDGASSGAHSSASLPRVRDGSPAPGLARAPSTGYASVTSTSTPSPLRAAAGERVGPRTAAAREGRHAVPVRFTADRPGSKPSQLVDARLNTPDPNRLPPASPLGSALDPSGSHELPSAATLRPPPPRVGAPSKSPSLSRRYPRRRRRVTARSTRPVLRSEERARVTGSFSGGSVAVAAVTTGLAG